MVSLSEVFHPGSCKAGIGVHIIVRLVNAAGTSVLHSLWHEHCQVRIGALVEMYSNQIDRRKILEGPEKQSHPPQNYYGLRNKEAAHTYSLEFRREQTAQQPNTYIPVPGVCTIHASRSDRQTERGSPKMQKRARVCLRFAN